jgi:L-alanine-DL-glutamate epimerase-like enolase superfamily enzyme
MKIKKIEIFQTHEDYKRPIPIAVGTHDSRDNILVKITADNGLSGWGEGSPLLPSYSGEVRDQMADDIVKRIAPDILEQDINEVNDISKLMNSVYHNKYYYMCTLAAVDIALFDLLGRMKKRPVYDIVREYLGLKTLGKELPELPTNFTVSRNATEDDDKIEEMIAETDEYIDRGYSVIKVKIGVFKDSDVKSVLDTYNHIKEKYPDRKVYLFADGNQAYKDVDEIYKVVKKIRHCVTCLEQPFHRDIPALSVELYKKLKKEPEMPLLITDEGTSSIEEMENVLISDAAGGALLKMVRSGGFSYVIKLMGLLKKYPEFKLGPCSMTETGIGTTANLHSALVVYDYCHPKLGFGFDGPLQVIGDSYKEGNDTIVYKNKKTGWFIRNKENIAVYDPEQIVGNGEGLGMEINQQYIDKITEIKSLVYVEDGKIVKESIDFKSNKEGSEILGEQEEILKHPRY